MCKSGATVRHRCGAASCKICHLVDCKNSSAVRSFYESCDDCGDNFSTPECMEAHRKDRCGKMRRCRRCWELCTTVAFEKHLCGKPFCPACMYRHAPQQGCVVVGEYGKSGPDDETLWNSSDSEGEEFKEAKVGANALVEELEAEEAVPGMDLVEAKESKQKIRVYADAETWEDPKTGDLTANLVVAHKITEGVEDHETFYYAGATAMKNFAEDLIKAESPFAKSLLFFHNGGGFDAHLLLRELLALETAPKVILRQQRILTMKLQGNNIALRDTLQFLTGVPLAKFASIFSLVDGEKGDFPHRANTDQWINFENPPDYLGPGGERFPPIALFCTDNLRPAALKKLEAWHAEKVAEYEANPELRYCPTDSLLKYCNQDVRILREGFETYRQRWIQQFPDMDPTRYITFASFNNALFRTKYMKKASIALLPPQGHEIKNRPGSIQALAWLAMVRTQLKEAGDAVVEQRTQRHGGEIRLVGMRVDGWFKTVSGQQLVLLYQGCR